MGHAIPNRNHKDKGGGGGSKVAMGDKHEYNNFHGAKVFLFLLCIYRDFQGGLIFVEKSEFYEVNINVGDALIFNISNIKSKIKIKN